ncbi:hypothetical protein MKW92_013407 [Papaver armeniacum]|nr:hypothetical protein MKW92_013407 [Papaver armeniacum]
MKFKQGNKVEVLRKGKKEFESCWYPGKIIYIAGSQYTVSYNLVRNSKGEPLVENVCRGDVRPIPPTTKRDGEWVIGDVFEVFDLSCWKVGKIAKVMNGNRVVIRLVGSIQLKEFHDSNLRVRQTWQNGEWVAAVKGGRERRDDNNDTLPKCSSLTQGLGKDGEHQEKFKNPTYEEVEEKLVNFLRKLKWVRTATILCIPFSMPVMVVTEDSNECSVASCSSNYLPDYKPRSWEISSKNGDSSCFDDVGSLHAYKSTVQALYASGPLSWEQESLLTNLRLSLNITNEDHLRLLRQLLSAQVL